VDGRIVDFPKADCPRTRGEAEIMTELIWLKGRTDQIGLSYH